MNKKKEWGQRGKNEEPPGRHVVAVDVVFTGFYRVLLGFSGFYRALLGFTGFYWVLSGQTGFILCFTVYYWVLLGFTGFYRVLLCFTVFYWVLRDSLGFYSILLGYAGLKLLYWVKLVLLGNTRCVEALLKCWFCFTGF